MNHYRICKTIAVPGTEKSNGVPRITKIRNTLAKLKIGDSFFIHRNQWMNATQGRSIVPFKEARREYGYSLKAKEYKHGIRIWRVT